MYYDICLKDPGLFFVLSLFLNLLKPVELCQVDFEIKCKIFICVVSCTYNTILKEFNMRFCDDSLKR